MLLPRVFALICLTAVCAAQDENDQTTTIPTPAYEPPEPELVLTSVNLDVFTSEKVVLRCSVSSGSNWIFTWERDGQPLGQNSDFSFPNDGSVLTITANRKDLAGHYRCQGKDQSGVRLTKTSKSLEVKVKEPPTPTLKNESPWPGLFIGEAVSFKCEVTGSEWKIIWYKDQQLLNKEGPRLDINSLTASDAGGYTCQAQHTSRAVKSGVSNSESLTVNANPRAASSEKVELTCSVRSGSDWIFTWERDGQVLGQNSDFSFPNDGSVLTITANRKDLAGHYTCQGKDQSDVCYTETSKSLEVKVKELPTPTLKNQSPWPELFLGEAVSFKCEVTGSEWKIIWYKDQQPLNKEGPRLDINSLTASDAGGYTCQAQHTSRAVKSRVSNSESLTVNPNSRAASSEKVELTCSVNSGSDWIFTWERDGQPLGQNSDFSFPNDGSVLTITANTKDLAGHYRCQGKDQSDVCLTKTSKSLEVKVKELPTPTLKNQSPWPELFIGEAVSFKCEVTGSEWKIIWYKDQQLLNKEGPRLDINSLTASDAGGYTCQAQHTSRAVKSGVSNSESLTVNQPPTPTLNKESPWPELFLGEAVSFKCEVTGSEWKIIWYKDQQLLNKERPRLDINSLTASDAGGYTCQAQHTSRAVKSGLSNSQSLTVKQNPKVSLTSSPAFETWYPKELINFKCNVDVPSSWTYEWYQNGSKINESTINNYKAAPLTHSSNGQYQCKVKRRGGQLYTSNDVSVKVAEPPTPIIKLETSWTDVYKTEKLRFSCTGPDSIWTLTWYKDQKKLETEGSALNIDSVTKDDKGVYTCKAEIKPRGVSSASSDTKVITVYENKPKPQLTRIPDFPTMYPGESVTFSCMVTESSGWEYEFYHRSTKIDPTSKSLERKVDVTKENSGEHQCLARRGQLKTEKSDPVSLHVSEIPVPVLKRKTQWWDVFPSERAELGCEMEGSSGWIFTWFKNGENVAGNSVTISEDGSILTITKASGSHHGNYSCSGELKDRTVRSIRSSEATLHVYDSKPTVTLLQNPDDKLLHTGDAISFTCHVNVSSGWKYSWYKDNNIISPTGITHNISSASTSETGSYECQVGRGEETPLFYSEKSRAVQLTVAERPKASIVLLTTWSEVFSTDSLKLQCEVVGSQDNWNYTWFKESEQLNQASLSTHSVTPSNDPDQSEYICQGIRTKRPLYSQRSDSYKTKNLLLKRRVLLSISGCLFFGIIAVFIGCIVMRVLRKPADADDKQDEANLFLTMAQLKDRNDAPCPLVEYITDADVNPPAKEGEENATSCTETTPLPITSPEEQAVTANGKETTENGSAMVSFLQ